MIGRSRRARRALSLLEVLLALAILGFALAAVGELMRIGSRNAEQARDLTTAQLHAESIMAQVVSGLLPAQSVALGPVEDLKSPDEWQYELEVQQIDQNSLIGVRVSVSQNPELVSRPVSFSLMRWMLDPLTTGTGAADETDAGQSSSSSATGG